MFVYISKRFASGDSNYFIIKFNLKMVTLLSTIVRAFHTHSDLLGDLVKLSLYPTDNKSKISAKSTASDGGCKSAWLAHVPDRKQASQADS